MRDLLLYTTHHVFTTFKGTVIHHTACPHHNTPVSVRMFWAGRAQDSSMTLRRGSCVCIIDAWCSSAVKVDGPRSADVELFIWRYQTTSSPPPCCCCLHSSTSSVNAPQNYFPSAYLFVHLSGTMPRWGVVYQSFLCMDTCKGIIPQNIKSFASTNSVSVETPESVTNSCNNHYNPSRF